MNIIICSQQESFYKTPKMIFFLQLYLDLVRFPISHRSHSQVFEQKSGGRKARVKYRSKVQRLVDALVNCISSKQQMLTLKEVLKNPTL